MKLSKLTDYGVVCCPSSQPRRISPNPLPNWQRKQASGPTVAKLMKLLARGRLVTSTRGIAGAIPLPILPIRLVWPASLAPLRDRLL